MKVLIIGGGGREHALAWRAAQSPQVEEVFVAPGNAGTALEPKVHNVQIGAEDVPALVAFARDNSIGLTIVGPEAALVAGVVDSFEEAGLYCFGPSRAAAELEGSKTFAKNFLARHGIPTAEYQAFSDLSDAQAYIHERGAPIVIKADGLAAGKGVTVARTIAEALSAAEDCLAGNAFGDAGARIVVEDFLEGEEASFICVVDGEEAVPLASSQDHKARDAGDKGPNTGGMGAYSPAPVLTAELHERVMREVIEPTIKGMAAEGRRYRGFLYAGLMIAPDGNVKVLEYNCRMGDPETQPIMLRLKSDLVDLCTAAIEGRLGSARIEWDSRPSLGVVMAAEGYPGPYRKGDVISGLPQKELVDRKVFHAGTALDDSGAVVTNGGRVLCVCALGDSVSDAQKRAYELADTIEWHGGFYRPDIGYRAVARERG